MEIVKNEKYEERFSQSVCVCVCVCVCVQSVVSDSMWPHDCSLPGSSVCGILQARILEWAAISSFMLTK